jgi:serine/threonine-protein kinase
MKRACDASYDAFEPPCAMIRSTGAMPGLRESLDRYEIEEPIGEGGMGTVYRAYDPKLRRRIAIKVLRDDGAAATAQLVREARAAAAFDHPNVVAIFDVGEASGRAFIAMELVVGRTLRAILRDGAATIADRMRWLVDVARALAAAHRAGLVHRDIKPENVIVRDDGVVKVLDFGIARRVAHDAEAPTVRSDSAPDDVVVGARATQDGALVGTPMYMAPEQLRGEPLDGRTDQFAWGVLAYELLTRDLPWPPGGALDVAVAIRTLEPAPFGSRASGAPPRVEAAVMRALAKDRAARFASMDALVDALDDSAPKPVSLATSAPDGLVRATRAAGRPPRRSLALPIAIAAIGAAAAAVVVAATSRSDDAPAKPPSAAASALAEGTRALREFDWKDAATAFEAAGPMPEAKLRLAIAKWLGEKWISGKEIEAAFRAAAPMRAALADPRDRAILEALASLFGGGRRDRAAAARAMAEAAARFDDAAELYAFASLLERADPEASQRAAERAVVLDAAYAPGWYAMGESLERLARFGEARAAFEKCVELSAKAIACLHRLVKHDLAAGRCADADADLKRLAVRTPTSGHLLRAQADAALGRDDALVAEQLQTLVNASATDPVSDPMLNQARLARFRGDLATASARVDEQLRRAETQLEAELRFDPYASRFELAIETGDDARATALAREFLSLRQAWPDRVTDDRLTDPPVDPTPAMLAYLARRGELPADELARRRAAWLDDRVRRGEHTPGEYWARVYAAPAVTRDDAIAALAELPRFAPIAPFLDARDGDLARGAVYLLADKIDDALPFLERQAASCTVLGEPIAWMRAHLLLGRAREAKHDRDGACAAYGAVLARWPKPTPKSVTVDAARERAVALECAPR